MVLKFTNKGKFLLEIGGYNKSNGNTDTKSVHQATDIQVYPKTNEVFVSDGYGNRRVIVFDANTGAFKRMWGAFGNVPTDWQIIKRRRTSGGTATPGEGDRRLLVLPVGPAALECWRCLAVLAVLRLAVRLEPAELPAGVVVAVVQHLDRLEITGPGPTNNAVTKQLDAEKTPKFQVLSANVGADGNGGVTFTGKGRFFDTMGSHFGFEAQGEYYYMHGQREGQADFGLVDRLGKHVQAGLFASFKHVNLAGNQTGGTLGEGALAVDYIFSRGRVGIFGTKGFLDNALINSVHGVDANGVIQNNVLVENYLKIVDQAGVAGTVGLWGKNYAEGNLGYLKSVAYGDHIGGTVRLIFPLNNKIALTAEGGVNETMLSRGNDGRAVFGVSSAT